MAAIVPVMSQEECQKRFKDILGVSVLKNGMFCAGGGEADACQVNYFKSDRSIQL